MSFWKWSKTAATNASADASINWAEGQAPSTVNDSARAMMAATAKWRDDISGTITTTGSSTAYSVTSNQVFDTLAHMDGAMIAFIPHTTCGNTVQLNVDGLGLKPLRVAPGVELVAGQLIAGTPYVVTYVNSSAVFYIQNIPGPPAYTMPIGAITPYVGASAPNTNYALCFGQAISRTTFATLFAITSTTYGTGDGSTTFNIPDLRGRVPAGKDNMGGSTGANAIGTIVTDNGTIVGSTLGSHGGSPNHIQVIGEMPTHNHNVTITDPGHGHTVASGPSLFGGPTAGGGAWGATGSFSITSNTTGITAITALQGSGNAMALLQPTIILTYIIRVL